MMYQTRTQAPTPPTRRDDQTSPYQRVREMLLRNPEDVGAWLRMSRIVEDPRRRQECIERALAIDPSCAEARDALDRLSISEKGVNPPSSPTPQANEPRKLGAYLVELGFVTPVQLEAALADQQAATAAGRTMTLGKALIKRGWLSPQQLAKALIAQQHDHLQHRSTCRAELLGDQLIRSGLISLHQLEGVLAVQAELHQLGGQIRLGELLVRFGYLTAEQVEQVLQQQGAQ